jgi:hypothetical protein
LLPVVLSLSQPVKSNTFRSQKDSTKVSSALLSGPSPITTKQAPCACDLITDAAMTKSRSLGPISRSHTAPNLMCWT